MKIPRGIRDSGVSEIVKNLYPFSYSVVSDDNDRAVAVFNSYLDFRVHEVPSGSEVGGWLVPEKWRVKRAEIRCSGKLIFNGLDSPLSVGVLSPSFSGVVDRNQLIRHVTVSEEVPSAVPYFWANLYRPLQRNWMFCAPYSFLEGLPDGPFQVDLETETTPGTMKILDFFLPGDSSDTILINAHNCHPWQANDDVSGCAVGIALMRELQLRPSRRFSYRLLIAPELIGTAHWLESYDFAGGKIVGALLLKAVGNDGFLKLQRSYGGTSALDMAATLAVEERGAHYESGAFRTIYGNDETVFDSPGYEIPSVSLVRFPFFGYHTSADTPELLSEDSLEETLATTLRIVDVLENNREFVFNRKGLISLSNLETPLYIHETFFGPETLLSDGLLKKWQLLMNCIPRDLEEPRSSMELALKYSLPHDNLVDYLRLWSSQGLVRELSEPGFRSPRK